MAKLETWKQGRLIDHLILYVSDIKRSRKFYRAVAKALGIEANEDSDHIQFDEIWISEGRPTSHVHLGFQAKSRKAVDAFYRAALAAGGRDNGPPGERDYHPGYYAAFVLDPDGNNIEATHQRIRKSAPAVRVARTA